MTVLLYDADCGFCRWSLAQVLRADRRGRLRPVSLRDPEADVLLSGMALEDRMASWHLVDEDGRVYSGGAAFAPLMRLIPGAGPLAIPLAAVPAVADLAYRLVAGRRSWLGRLIPRASAARARQRIEAASASSGRRADDVGRDPADRHRRGGGVA
jgi:predicted DCC family thiol-disulfide oxidoreductase YuxK